MIKSKSKKKEHVGMDKIMLHINKLIPIHDCTFIKSCDKKGNTLSLTSINGIEYKREDKLIYLKRTISDQLEVISAFMRESVQNITYETEFKNDCETLVVTVTTC